MSRVIWQFPGQVFQAICDRPYRCPESFNLAGADFWPVRSDRCRALLEGAFRLFSNRPKIAVDDVLQFVDCHQLLLSFSRLPPGLWRNHLDDPAPKRMLVRAFGPPAWKSLLSKTYYTRYRHDLPTTMADARRCLPVGYGKFQAGIHLQSGTDDIIWQAMVSLNLAAGAGKLKKSVDRTLDAVDGGRLTEPTAARMLTDASRQAAARDPELQERVLQTLPAGNQDGSQDEDDS